MYDAVIVGGGITGISAAIHLINRGFKTLIIEKCRLPCGATAYSGGIFTRIIDEEYFREYAFKSHKFYMQVIKDADFINWGYVILEDIDEALYDYNTYRGRISEIRFLEHDELEEVLGIKLSLDEDMAGLYIIDDFTVNPSKLNSFLIKRFLDMGGDLLIDTYLKYFLEDGKVKVATLNNSINTGILLLCMGAWGDISPNTYRNSWLIDIPIFRFNVSIKVGFWDEELYGYFRPENGDMVGGFYNARRIDKVSDGFRGPDKEVIEQTLKLLKRRLGFKPYLVDTWSAPVAISNDYRPFYLRLDEGVYSINGFGGRGIIVSPGFTSYVINEILRRM